MSEIEWMPARWDQVKPGDRVKLVHNDGEQAIIGTVADGYTSFMPLINNLAGRASGVICFHSVDAEWSLFIERAKPALPTEPGIYLSSIVADGPWLFELDPEGWRCLNTNSPFPLWSDQIYRNAPFTRLESVAETVARFAARLHAVVQPKIDSDWYTKATARKILEQADAIATEFVTGELGE